MRKFKSLIAVLVSITCFFSLFSLSAGAAASTGVSVNSDLYSSSGSSIGVTNNKNIDEAYYFSFAKSGKYVGDEAFFVAYWPSTDDLKWSVSNSSVATLEIQNEKTDSGYVTYGSMAFVKAGTCKLKAVDIHTGKVIFKKTLTINPYVQNITFKQGSKYVLNAGETAVLKYAVTKDNGKKVSASAIPEAVTFKAASSDTNVVKVKASSTGKIKIKAVGSGTAKVKVKAKDGSGTTATIKIKVK